MIATIVSNIKLLARSKQMVLVAIDGVGGSGKTTLAEKLRKDLENCAIIQMDDFYSPRTKAADLYRLKRQVLLPLYHDRQAKYQVLEWKTNRLSDWHILNPGGIVIFEGVYSLEKSIRRYYDLKIWVDYPADLGFERGIARDIARDGVDNSDRWKNIWMPLEEKYENEQAPEKAADYIVKGNELL